MNKHLWSVCSCTATLKTEEESLCLEAAYPGKTEQFKKRCYRPLQSCLAKFLCTSQTLVWDLFNQQQELAGSTFRLLFEKWFVFCLYPVKLISAFIFILLIYSINSIRTKCFYPVPFHPLTRKSLFKYQFYSEQFSRAEFSVGFKVTFENIQQILFVHVLFLFVQNLS